MTNTPFDALSDQDLLATIGTLAVNERHATAELIAALSELDTRKLYLAEGCSPLFTYCTQVLHTQQPRGQAVLRRGSGC